MGNDRGRKKGAGKSESLMGCRARTRAPKTGSCRQKLHSEASSAVTAFPGLTVLRGQRAKLCLAAVKRQGTKVGSGTGP